MKNLVVPLLALALSGILSHPLFAESAKLTGSATPTGFSGHAGTDRTLSKSASANDAIFAVEVAERSDDPCFFKARYRDVATGAEESSLRFASCSDNNNNEGTNDSRKTVSLPADSFVTGVRICLNADRDKMKGIQLLGRLGGCLLGSDTITGISGDCTQVVKVSGHDYRTCGSPTFIELECDDPALSLSAFMERTNCPGSKNGPDGDWESQVSCPAQMVATGMRLSTRSSGGGRTMIDGIALDCVRLTTGG